MLSFHYLLVQELIRMWLSDTIAQEVVWSDEDLFPIYDDLYQEYEDEAPWSDEDLDGYDPQDAWNGMAEDAFLDSYWESRFE